MKAQSPSKILLASIVLMAASVGFAQAQQRSEEAVLLDEALKALKAARADNIKLEEDKLRLAKQVKHLGQSLAEANRNLKQSREDYTALRLQTEALGVETVINGEKGAHKRILQAISDLRIVKEERDAMAHALADLSDSIKAFITTAVSTDVETRAALQAALGQAEKTIGVTRQRPANEAKKSLDEGKVISLKRDFGLLVLNLGTRDGAKVGMPFEIIRKDRPVGSAMIVDVRDNVCGAVITKLIDESDDAQVGDRVKVETQKKL